MLDRVLVERALPETVHAAVRWLTVLLLQLFCLSRLQRTKGGIVIPEKAQGKVNEAKVVAVGPGGRGKVGGGAAWGG